MKAFQVKSGNLLFTISYDEDAGIGTMSAGGRTAAVTVEFAKWLEELSETSRTDLLDTVFKCRREMASLVARIDEREAVSLDANSLLANLLTKVKH